MLKTELFASNLFIIIRKNLDLAQATMSGYRNLHRQQVHEDGAPVWQAQPSVSKSGQDCWNVWTASGDGLARVYRVQEKAASDDLDASALSLSCSHILLGKNQVSSKKTILGCTQLSLTRNYVGDDDMAGDWIAASLDLSGRVRVWIVSPDNLSTTTSTAPESPTQIRCNHEFVTGQTTGTLMAICPPRIAGDGNVCVALAQLDGTIAMVSTGIATPKAKNSPSEPGTVLETWGNGTVAMSMAWHPSEHTLVVGRRNGTVDVLKKKKNNPSRKVGSHRLQQHSGPVRAVTFTPDGQLLVTGSDDGYLAVWDTQRRTPTLVHHVVQAHTGWILGVTALSDSRRFVTTGTDQKLHVWHLSQMHAPVHSFHGEHSVWTLSSQPHSTRMVGGTDDGWLQVYSLEDK